MCHPAGRRRRHHRRQDEQPGVLLPRHDRQRAVRPDAQPGRPEQDDRRIERRCRRLGRRRYGSARGRDRRRWLDPDPVGLLRHLWPQAQPRSRTEAARLSRLADSLGHRPDRRICPRPRAGGLGHGRSVGTGPAQLSGSADRLPPARSSRRAGTTCGSPSRRTSASPRSTRTCGHRLSAPPSTRSAMPVRTSRRRIPNRSIPRPFGTRSPCPRATPPKARWSRRTPALVGADAAAIALAGATYSARHYLDSQDAAGRLQPEVGRLLRRLRRAC